LPPDGGLHAWFIVFASFLTNGIVFGIHNCYGIIYLRLRVQLEQAGVSEAALKACKFFLSIITNHPLFIVTAHHSIVANCGIHFMNFFSFQRWWDLFLLE
jgi:hypothetical protein